MAEGFCGAKVERMSLSRVGGVSRIIGICRFKS